MISLPAQLVRTRRFTLGVPDRFTISPDGARVLFLRTRAGDDPVACLWSADLATGTEILLADPAELASPPGDGIGEHAAAAGTGLVAFTLAGELWTVHPDDGRSRRLPAAGPAADPRPDPSGARIGYLSGGAVRVIEADGSRDRPIAAPDGPEVTFGAAELTGTTAADGAPRGYWWAPDGGGLLVARTDASAVGLWHIADPADPATAPRPVRYAAVGQANAEVSLWITGLDGTRVQARWDAGAFEYLVGAGWDGHGPYAVVQSRDQRTVVFLGIDPGSGETTLLAEQADDRWVQLVPGLPARTGSGVLLGHADLAGTRHLTADGVPVTPPGLQLGQVLSVDGDEVLFRASREPTQAHLWSYRPGAGVEQLTSEPAMHTGARRAGTLVHVTWGTHRPGDRVTVRRPDGPDVDIESTVERPVLAASPIPLVLGPRELRAALFLPSWHRGGRLPVLADPYGGAAMQRVTAERDWHALVSQWIAEQGFAVLVADGRGTPGRGPDWERAVYGDLFGPAIDDQVTAVREAARLRPELDLGRVGIRGWSYGGSLAAAAVLARPDVFHAAVAGAGVTDQRLYETHWRERFLGDPGKFPERYAASSLVAQAPRLSRPLLLIHGLVDSNVYPASTLLLSSALLAAGRPHEVLLLPGVGHQAMQSDITENLLMHQVRFLQRHLRASPGEPAGPA
jgi:dipeptidyl-peptidase-4